MAKNKTTTKTKAPKPEKKQLQCGCGCGESVSRRFRPGHDGRLKGRLIEAHLNGKKMTGLPEWVVGDSGGDPMAIARSLNWNQFLERAQERAEGKDREGEKVAKKRAARKPAPPKGKVRAKVGRWEYDGVIEKDEDGTEVFVYAGRAGNEVRQTSFTLVD